MPSALPSTPDVPYRCALDVPGRQPPAVPSAQQKAPGSLAEWSLKPSRAAPVVPRIQAERSPQTKAARSQRQQHVESRGAPRGQQQWSHHVDPRPSPSLAVTATSSLHTSFISPFQVPPSSSSEPHLEPKTHNSALAQGAGHRHHQKINGGARAGGEGREVATADAVLLLVQHDRQRSEPSRGPAERLPTPAARPTSTSLHGSFPMKL